MELKQLVEQNFGSLEGLNEYAKKNNKYFKLEITDHATEDDILCIGTGVHETQSLTEDDLINANNFTLDDISEDKHEGWYFNSIERHINSEEIPNTWVPVDRGDYTSIEDIKNDFKVTLDRGKIISLNNIRNTYDEKNRLIHQYHAASYKDKLYIDDDNVVIVTGDVLKRRITSISDKLDSIVYKNLVYSTCYNGDTEPVVSTDTYYKDDEGKVEYAIFKDDKEEYPYGLLAVDNYTFIGDELYIIEAKGLFLVDND